MSHAPSTTVASEADQFDLPQGSTRFVRFGSASDRYAAWLDQIYPRDVWAGEVKTRKKNVGGQSRMRSGVLPVSSVEDYFLHFGVLEVDSTYYRPLTDENGTPSPVLFTLERYSDRDGALGAVSC